MKHSENDKQTPLHLIDFGSALLAGQTAELDDYTEIYAPPEAPDPDPASPFTYDIYSVAIIGLRCLMPALLAGEAGVQTLGAVACSELPAADYDFREWCCGRANDNAAPAQAMPLNAECAALLQLPELYNLLADMLSRDPADRPSARECLHRLGAEWIRRLEEGRLALGREVPLLWEEGTEWRMGGTDAGGASANEEKGGDAGFQVGEWCVIRRSDGKLKFGQVKADKSGNRYDVTVEVSGFPLPFCSTYLLPTPPSRFPLQKPFLCHSPVLLANERIRRL